MRHGGFNYSRYSPPCDEVRQSNDEGANGHQHTTNCNDLRPMEFGSKVTDKSNHQQVSWKKETARKVKNKPF